MALAVMAIVVFYLTLLAVPEMPAFSRRAPDYASVHLLLEMFAIAISMMVVSVAWFGLSRREVYSANSLVACFTVVCIADTWHALVYEGMPSLIVEAGTNRAVYFWFAGRFFESLALALVLLRVRLPGSPTSWLGGGLLLSVLIVVVGLFALDRLPVFFVPGQGVTPLKAAVEYGLFGVNLVLAAALYWRSRTDPSGAPRLLAWSSFAIALGSLAFARYTNANDLVNLIGHLLKIVAYVLVYMATLRAGISEPYAELEKSGAALHASEQETRRLLESLPVGIARIGSDLRFRFVNHRFAAGLGHKPDEIVGRSMDEHIALPNLEESKRNVLRALEGTRSDYEMTIVDNGGAESRWQVTVVPSHEGEAEDRAALAMIVDVTEATAARLQASESLREVADLKAALDAHAIVAVTDARGVITRVNDKFCAISQYSRSELIGKTHAVVNSGHHDRVFFRDMWRTISRGIVWNGEICNRAKDGSLYWVHTTIVPMIGANGLPEQYIAIRADITKRVKAEEEAMRSAMHDALTGLPNRRQMMERLHLAIEQAQTTGKVGALVLLDLDNFKEVNDTLGHPAGDHLLKQCANRVLRNVGPNDTVARLGGDEFAVILGHLGNDSVAAGDMVKSSAERLCRVLSPRYMVAGQDVETTASLGVVIFGRDAPSADEVLKQADLALYKSKGAGRNVVSFFDPALQAELVERAALLQDLRSAISRGEMTLHYQPVVDANRRVLGVEALLRWQHPVRGNVSPGQFIPLAESYGLILEVGNWVLGEACRQLAIWAEEPDRAHWTVAVNVSARQFHEPDFVARVESALARSGARADRLRLELTESMLHEDLEQTIGKMFTLRGRGVRFALDDFGTGYSSLAYLKRLPIDQLKIDRSFVSDVLVDANDAAIARTVLALAKNLDLHVVAEGVETEGQWHFLLDHGCESFQGYLFSRPVPPGSLPS